MNILNYYNNDFPNLGAINKTFKLIIDGTEILISCKALFSMDSESRLLAFYIAQQDNNLNIIYNILDNLENVKKDFNDTVTIGSNIFEMSVGNIDKIVNTYSKQFYIYFEGNLTPLEINLISEKCTRKGLIIGLRGTNYQKTKTEFMKPLAFISHDNRDKEAFARVIYNGLHKRLVPVWFDEYALKPGDSLRESIELGLKNSRKCIFILTKNFLSNNGWTKKEFDSIFTRELIKEENILIPIWVNLTKHDIYEFSPSLADRVALIWPPENLEKVQYDKKVEELISKIHLSLLK